jgi:teichuronic acid biosynthesis glycosyltransferase TuaC
VRVLICIDSLGAGGKERQVVELVKGLARSTDLECTVTSLESDVFYLDDLAGLGIPVEFGLRRMRWDFGVFWRLYRSIRRYRPHVIHTFDAMSSFYALPIAKRMHIPLINASIRNAFSRGGFRWSLERLLLKLSDYRVANSYAGLRSRGFADTDTKNFVITNGFDLSRVERTSAKSNSELPFPAENTKTVGMVAGFSRHKDYATFIRAARELTRRRRGVRFVAVGDGETLEANRKLAADVGAITFLGKRRNVEDIVATFDVGVLSTFTEGISNSLMEYMALRKPVVATDGGGTRELVVDGQTGFLVPPEKPEALAAKIEYLLDNPDDARRMGEAGEARLRSEFSSGRMVEKTVKLYELATTAHSRGVPARHDRREDESGVMRILLVTNMYPTPERPGYGAFVSQQAEQLRRAGHVIDVVNILGFRSRLNYLKGALEVLWKTSRIDYDVVHAHYGQSAFPAWFRWKAPLVVTLHGSDVLVRGLFQSFCSRVVSRFADAVIVVSEEMRRRISGLVIPCGVDLEVFRPYDRHAARARLGWSKDKHLILFPFDPGRSVKRYDLAKAAVERVANEGLDVELVTVFSVENREMPWYYSAADAMILCSDSEGSPTSVKEALACNLPVVATDVGDIRDILRGIEGTRICSQDVGELAQSLREVLEISQRGGFDGRTAMTRYDETHTADRIVGLYRDVVKRFRIRQKRGRWLKAAWLSMRRPASEKKTSGKNHCGLGE